MSRIKTVFDRTGRKALVPYVTVGYPSIEATLKVVPLLADAGADIVELGIPFSDPLADGVTIQRASYRALQQGVTPKRCIEVAGELRRKVKIPLAFMSYFNPVHSYGLEGFCVDCAGAGVDGLIIPDLPPEEAGELDAIALKKGLDLIYFLSPSSTDERIKMVAGKARGFIYLVSVTGVTGAREALPPELAGFVGRVRKATRQPVCVGFGISTPAQATSVAAMADGVIVGSRIIQLMESDETLASVKQFVAELRRAIDGA